MRGKVLDNSKLGSFSDEWELHKNDFAVWRKFWALWELRRKWRWANWFYKHLDRIGNEIVESGCWGIEGGVKYMNLCLWTALLRSVQEGIIKGLDSPREKNKVPIEKVLGLIPENLKSFPQTLIDSFRNFRNAVFHCQWVPNSEKLKFDQATTQQLETLHLALGNWIDQQFEAAYQVFKTKYDTPYYWVGVNFMSDEDESMI